MIELQALIAEYWAAVDRVGDVKVPAASFFTDSAEMHLGALKVRGRAELEAFFKARDEREIANKRTTRHYTVNFRASAESVDRFTVTTLVLVHSGVGEWPLTSAPPSAIGDFTFECVRASAGWQFQKVTGTSVFVGADAPAFAKST